MSEPWAELTRLSRAQLEAARSGDFEGVRLHLGARQRILDGLAGRRAEAAALAPLAAMDAEVARLLAAEERRLEQALARLQAGGRALAGYAGRPVARPGLLERMG
jgi:hypothetical protein